MMDLDFTWDYYFMIGGREWAIFDAGDLGFPFPWPVYERLAYPRPRPWGRSRPVRAALKAPQTAARLYECEMKCSSHPRIRG
jgi:hypothetical protein